MKKVSLMALIMLLVVSLVTGCTNSAAGGKSKEADVLTFVWYPNESGEDLKAAREEFGKIIETATGKKVEHQLTTDYAIAIESIANGNAQLCFPGAQGYIEARNKNQNVIPLVVNSDNSGTLNDAVYYSWLAVRKGEEGNYKNGNDYAIDNIAGKKFSFVSTSSTSGFKVPSNGITTYFSKIDQYKDLKQDDLLEGGKNKFFSEVQFGGSHQGSAVNLLTKKVDVAAFCDTELANYAELAEGKANTPGAVYSIRKDASEPFNTMVGQEFVVISVTPVLNAPIIGNADTMSKETIDKIITTLTSDEVAKNPLIFVPKDSSGKGIFKAPQRFLAVEDAWFNPIRELSK
ncbi:MAG: PhnD/SsuA/transferrin family substrate-binding protein [Desulfitobacterium sp.]